MKILVIEQDDDFREDLVLRIDQAVKMTELRGVSLLGRSLLNAASESPDLIFLSFLDDSDYSDILFRVRGIFPQVPIILVVPSEQYVEEAVMLRRKFSVRVVALGDIPQCAQIIIDLDSAKLGLSASNTGTLISFVHVRGGVGNTSTALALGNQFASLGYSTLLGDFDFIKQDLTQWAVYGPAARKELRSLFQSKAPVTRDSVRTIVEDIELPNGSMSFLGAAASHSEGVLGYGLGQYSNEPTDDRLEEIILELLHNYEVLVLDCGNMWGVSTLTALALSSRVVCVLPDDEFGMTSTLKTIKRLAQESEDPLEFDFSKWEYMTFSRGIQNKTEEVMSLIQSYGFDHTQLIVNQIPQQKKANLWLLDRSDVLGLADKHYGEFLERTCGRLVAKKR